MLKFLSHVADADAAGGGEGETPPDSPSSRLSFLSMGVRGRASLREWVEGRS